MTLEPSISFFFLGCPSISKLLYIFLAPNIKSRGFNSYFFFKYSNNVSRIRSFPSLTSHTSHKFTVNFSCNLILGAIPGSPNYIIGTAKFKNAFFIFSIFSFLSNLINSIV